MIEERDDLSVRLVFVGHGAQDVAFGVLELRQDADGRDRRLFHDDAAAVFHDRRTHAVEIVDGDGALETVRPALAPRLLALVQQPLHTWPLLVACVNKIEIRRTPRLEAPAQNGFVEPPAALHIFGVNSKAGEIVGHFGRLTVWCRCRNHAILTFYVENTPYTGRRAPFPLADPRSRLCGR